MTTKPQSTTEPPVQIWLTVFEDNKEPRFVMVDWHKPDVRNTQPGDYVAIRPHHKVEYAPVSRKYFCSCGAALTAEEYITHYFEMGHDHAIGARDAASAAPVVGEDDLHLAICQAVHLMNQGDLHAGHDLLRQTLIDYADKRAPLTRSEVVRQQQRSGSSEVSAIMVSPAAATAAPVEQSDER